MSMKFSDAPFKDRLGKGINDTFMRKAVAGAQERLAGRRLLAAETLGNWEQWRELSEEIRQHTINNLDFYLNQLTENIEKLGGHVFFAETKEDATKYIADVVKNKNAKNIVKAKSMVTEEINLNHVLLDMGCDVVESDLGEWILQVDDWEPPSHIVTPALHKNREQIREVFERQGYKGTSQPEEMARFARERLREKFLACEVGITGCNFAIAESGSVTLVTNEGNGRMVTTVPKTQISVMGMERIVPTFADMEVLVGMLTRSAVGQKLTSYISVTTGPKRPDEVDGPEEFHLVVVDNGRSKILKSEFKQVLQCIRCAACLNVCPVYRHVGGHAYGSIYSGPIGAVITPLLGGYKDSKELPYASTLCGACTDACPVKIPLHQLLLKHRRNIVEKEGLAPIAEQLIFKGYGMGFSNTSLYKLGTKFAPSALKMMAIDGKTIHDGIGPLKGWTSSRDLPVPTRERFRDWYEKREKGGNK
ncbi:MAG: iron-sulfur cluster-binding protein [Bacillales bacterium]|nr:iron-sulfur cluster-binding protein [Bacillales bacterium]